MMLVNFGMVAVRWVLLECSEICTGQLLVSSAALRAETASERGASDATS